MKEMTNKQRIITTIRHEEPDRVPVSPRLYSWLQANHGGIDLETHMKYLPDMDFMFIIEESTPNYLETYPNEYNLTDVKVDQTKKMQGDLIAVERTFHTPAGAISDRTLIPPANRVYGLFPNPIKTEYLVKSPADLERLPYILPEINTNYDYYHDHVKQIVYYFSLPDTFSKMTFLIKLSCSNACTVTLYFKGIQTVLLSGIHLTKFWEIPAKNMRE